MTYIHVDFPPSKDCKRPIETVGMICIKCNDCGRFDYGGDKNPVRSDIKIIMQSHSGYPPFWEYPERFGGYYDNGKGGTWYSRKHKIEDDTNIEDILPLSWYPERLDHVRWWIEGRNF